MVHIIVVKLDGSHFDNESSPVAKGTQNLSYPILNKLSRFTTLLQSTKITLEEIQQHAPGDTLGGGPKRIRTLDFHVAPRLGNRPFVR